MAHRIKFGLQPKFLKIESPTGAAEQSVPAVSKKRRLAGHEKGAPRLFGSLQTTDDGSKQLIAKGQGIVQFGLKEISPFFMIISSPDAPFPNSIKSLKLEVDSNGAEIYFLNDKDIWTKQTTFQGQNSGLDQDPKCKYWFSIDSHNRWIRYGKGEMRKNTMLAECVLPAIPKPPAMDPFAWLKDVRSVHFDSQIVTAEYIWRDPVVIDPPLVVLPTEDITMDQVAANIATVPANLTAVCQQLYNNVSGKNFQLNTPEFPNFVDAIEESIRNPDLWCYKRLAEKRGELGDSADETYLRITMGLNQGDSPGIPYVIEIWPAGHYSPIHNHAESDAVIRVLHGTIHVSLYPMLSKYHMEPFMQTDFREGEVTWISPLLNQTHQLKNISDRSCITIQCYMYAEDNTVHYDYFDYLDATKGGDTDIKQFTPDSDMSFLDFKVLMKSEWQQAHPNSK